MALVFGLGNPGARYARTRHNAGWRVLEALLDRWEAVPGEHGSLYRSWRAERGGVGVDLVAPLTFMNRCGEALQAWRERHGLELAELLVVADDVYLPVGHVRLRARGSSGGHLGLESVEAALASRDYARLRLGVGAAAEAAELRRHVLADFAAADEEQVEQAVRVAADAVECWLEEGVRSAMSRFNRRVRKEVSEP